MVNDRKVDTVITIILILIVVVYFYGLYWLYKDTKLQEKRMPKLIMSINEIKKELIRIKVTLPPENSRYESQSSEMRYIGGDMYNLINGVYTFGFLALSNYEFLYGGGPCLPDQYCTTALDLNRGEIHCIKKWLSKTRPDEEKLFVQMFDNLRSIKDVEERKKHFPAARAICMAYLNDMKKNPELMAYLAEIQGSRTVYKIQGYQ